VALGISLTPSKALLTSRKDMASGSDQQCPLPPRAAESSRAGVLVASCCSTPRAFRMSDGTQPSARAQQRTLSYRPRFARYAVTDVCSAAQRHGPDRKEQVIALMADAARCRRFWAGRSLGRSLLSHSRGRGATLRARSSLSRDGRGRQFAIGGGVLWRIQGASTSSWVST
jgi:hypothetical protein